MFGIWWTFTYTLWFIERNLYDLCEKKILWMCQLDMYMISSDCPQKLTRACHLKSNESLLQEIIKFFKGLGISGITSRYFWRPISFYAETIPLTWKVRYNQSLQTLLWNRQAWTSHWSDLMVCFLGWCHQSNRSYDKHACYYGKNQRYLFLFICKKTYAVHSFPITD